MENRTAIRLVKALVETSPTFDLLNGETKKNILEYINTQIEIEEDVNYEGE
jgi:hypothetical protein